MDCRRRQAGHDRQADADVRFGIEGFDRSRDVGGRRPSAGRRARQPEGAQADREADRRQRRRAAGKAAREDRRGEFHLVLMTGVLDRRTPMPQTEEYYAALKMKGVPVKLLQFNEEYHGTGSKPSNYIRTQLYMMSWFNKYTRAADGRVTSTSQP
ncbi:MAG: hypothetical protein DMF95_07615 [Acidobacteria bacterium]|nr:MAG: hypothetical protein DMF95_07615 [Acidobacteriota bacterium]